MTDLPLCRAPHESCRARARVSLRGTHQRNEQVQARLQHAVKLAEALDNEGGLLRADDDAHVRRRAGAAEADDGRVIAATEAAPCKVRTRGCAQASGAGQRQSGSERERRVCDRRRRKRAPREARRRSACTALHSLVSEFGAAEHTSGTS